MLLFHNHIEITDKQRKCTTMQGYRRHAVFYSVMRWLLSPWLKGYFHLAAEPAPAVPAPYLVIANHTTDFDSLFVALSFPQQMYYVASEHIFRSPFLRRFFAYMLAPIPKRKGGADVSTAMQMVRRLRAGHNIMLFAEGNKSFDGLPCPIHSATAGVVKASGATLITYHFVGGYFTHPRWARTLRRGKVTGRIVGVYTPETLAAMTEAQINTLITNDIAEDAYARQQAEKIHYRGKRLAEGIENALYLCPACKSIGTIQSKGNAFACTCGLHGRYLDTGYLEGETLPFDTLTAWCAWQRGELAAMLQTHCETAPDTAAARDGMRKAAGSKADNANEATTPPASNMLESAPTQDAAFAGNTVIAAQAAALAPTKQQMRVAEHAPAPFTPPDTGAPSPMVAANADSAEAIPPTALLWDAGQTLLRILPDHSAEVAAQGTLSLTHTGLYCGTFHCPLSALHGLEVYGRSTIVFSDGAGNRYQVRSQTERSGLKYFEAYHFLKGRRD